MARLRNGPPRILYLIENEEMGGLEADILNLIAHLDRTQFEPIVVCSQEGRFTEQLQELGVETLLFPIQKHKRVMDLFDSVSLSVLMRLAKAVRKRNIALLHSYEFRSRNYANLLALLTGIPLICGCSMPNWGEKMHGVQLRIINALAKEIVTVSHTIREGLLARCIIDPSKIKVIHPGVDLTRFSLNYNPSVRAEFKIPPESPLVGIVARFDPAKDLSGFIRAAALVAKELPESRFMIIGGQMTRFDTDYPRVLQTLKEVPNPEKFILTGPRDDVPSMLAGIDILVSSSIRESFGVALLEAMASGKPVVATQSGGPEEIVVHGETGLLVPANEPNALAQAILALLRDNERRRAMGIAGRRRVQELFDEKVQVQKFESLYRLHIRKPRSIRFQKA